MCFWCDHDVFCFFPLLFMLSKSQFHFNLFFFLFLWIFFLFFIQPCTLTLCIRSIFVLKVFFWFKIMTNPPKKTNRHVHYNYWCNFFLLKLTEIKTHWLLPYFLFEVKVCLRLWMLLYILYIYFISLQNHQ